MADSSEWIEKPDLSQIKVGDKIRIKKGATNKSPYGNPNNVKFASWVPETEYDVQQVGVKNNPTANYVVFGIGVVMTGTNTTGAVYVEDIERIKPKTPTVVKQEETAPPETPKTETKVSAPITIVNGAQDVATDFESGLTVYRNDPSGHGVYMHSAKAVEPGGSTFNPKLERYNDDVLTPQMPLAYGHFEKYPYGHLINDDGEKEFSPSFTRKTRLVTEGDRKIRKVDFALRPTFDYTINPPEVMMKELNEIEGRSGIPTIGDNRKLYQSKCNNYFRWKFPNPNGKLTRAFAHVFFTRPDLNILRKEMGNGNVTEFKLSHAVENDPDFLYAWKKNPDMLKQLVDDNGMTHRFMFVLSNSAASFSLLDETLKNATWGESWTGNKISYGMHNIDMKTAGEFSIDYSDDRNLNIYHLHKLWMDYISKVYRGELMAGGEVFDAATKTWIKQQQFEGKGYAPIEDRILDYACSVYYILTAEDGETIIFWSKYYGVYPTIAPSSALSFTGKALDPPKYQINYHYSYKQDFNPYNLAEFNNLSNLDSSVTYVQNGKSYGATYNYVPTYDPLTLGAGFNKVGAPFIETVNGSSNNPATDGLYELKLRFRPAIDDRTTAGKVLLELINSRRREAERNKNIIGANATHAYESAEGMKS